MLKILDKRLNMVFLIALLLIPLAAPSSGKAQDPTPSDDEVNAIAKQLYCPVCENVPLDECGTQACIQWRGVIRDKLEAGWTEEEIKRYFVEQYGDRVLAQPPLTGLNWLVYLVPIVAFLAGAFLLYQGFRTWKTASKEDSKTKDRGPEKTEGEEKYISRLEEELRNR